MPVTRRNILFGTAATAAVAFAHPMVRAQAQAPAGPFRLDPLPYPANALEPHIDARTMEIHHGRHHQAYVTNLNNAVKDHSNIASMQLHEILAKLNEMPESVRTAIRNNGGGHANHTMFWQVMGPPQGTPAANQPSGELLAAIESDLNGLDTMKSRFEETGTRVFGSGWVFVTVTRDGKLAIEGKPNQDTPLMEGKHVLFGNDVWEHAYYLKYQNRRPDYLKAWWNVVNWEKVGDRYAAAKAGRLTI
jgi:Fe-Mn family superoxide dismutase